MWIIVASILVTQKQNYSVFDWMTTPCQWQQHYLWSHLTGWPLGYHYVLVTRWTIEEFVVAY